MFIKARSQQLTPKVLTANTTVNTQIVLGLKTIEFKTFGRAQQLPRKSVFLKISHGCAEEQHVHETRELKRES